MYFTPTHRTPVLCSVVDLCIASTLSEKRYKSCHWGCTYSKGKLLSILGANLYILGANMYISGANLYILGANMYISGANMYILGANMYIDFRC